MMFWFKAQGGEVGGNTKAGDPSTLGAPSYYEVSKKPHETQRSPTATRA